jgi:hypothetical protein
MSLAAAAPALIEGAKFAWDNRDNITQGGKTLIKLGKKVHSNVIKPLANTLFSKSKRRKAASEIMNKIRNPIKTIKEGSNLIKSGKLQKVAKSVARDVGSALDASEKITGKDLSNHKSIVSGAHDNFNRYHDVLSRYNDQGRKSFL